MAKFLSDFRDLIPVADDWDLSIMKTYPYRVADLWANPENYDQFDEIIDWAEANLDRDNFTWKSLTFFFKTKEDMMHFMLRWL